MKKDLTLEEFMAVRQLVAEAVANPNPVLRPCEPEREHVEIAEGLIAKGLIDIDSILAVRP